MYSMVMPNIDALEGKATITIFNKENKSQSISVDAFYKVNSVGEFTVKEAERKRIGNTYKVPGTDI